jgi:hypothetical protein
LLHGTLCFLEHFAFCVPESKVCWGEHFTKEKNVPGSKFSFYCPTAQMAEFMFPNVVYRETAYRTGVPGIKMC